MEANKGQILQLHQHFISIAQFHFHCNLPLLVATLPLHSSSAEDNPVTQDRQLPFRTWKAAQDIWGLYGTGSYKAFIDVLVMKCREWICSHRGLEKVGKEEATPGSGSNSWEPHCTEAKRGNSQLHSSNSVHFDLVCIMYHTHSLTHPVPSPLTDPHPYTP